MVKYEEEADEGETKELTRRQVRAVRALITERTVEQAAEKARVSRSSIYRWLREDENFQREIKTVRRQMLEQATIRLHKTAIGAAEVLDQVIRDKETSAASKVSGARTALDFAYRAFELEDIEERLSDVERRLRHNPPAKPAVNIKWIEVHGDGEEEGEEAEF